MDVTIFLFLNKLKNLKRLLFIDSQINTDKFIVENPEDFIIIKAYNSVIKLPKEQIIFKTSNTTPRLLTIKFTGDEQKHIEKFVIDNYELINCDKFNHIFYRNLYKKYIPDIVENKIRMMQELIR